MARWLEADEREAGARNVRAGPGCLESSHPHQTFSGNGSKMCSGWSFRATDRMPATQVRKIIRGRDSLVHHIPLVHARPFRRLVEGGTESVQGGEEAHGLSVMDRLQLRD